MSSFNILTKTEIAKCFGVTNASVSMWIKRRKLFPDEDGRIDISELRNATHIEVQASKGKIFDISKLMDLPKIVAPTPVAVVEVVEEKAAPRNKARKITPPKSVDRNSLAELEKKKKKLDIQKIEKAIRLDELKIEKLEGSLIPFDAAKGMFLYVVENFANTYIQGLDSQINVFVQRFGGAASDLADLRKELKDLIAELKDEAKENSLKGLDGIVDEYAEVRGRGERK